MTYAPALNCIKYSVGIEMIEKSFWTKSEIIEKSFLMKSEMIEKEFFKDGAFHHVFFELFSRTTDTRAGRLVARFHCLL